MHYVLLLKQVTRIDTLKNSSYTSHPPPPIPAVLFSPTKSLSEVIEHFCIVSGKQQNQMPVLKPRNLSFISDLCPREE
jgi:hypothetical protein